MTVNGILEHGWLNSPQLPLWEKSPAAGADGSALQGGGYRQVEAEVDLQRGDSRSEESTYQPSDWKEDQIRRAVSDMKQDKVLWQYQYFVDGSARGRDAIRSWEEGSVRVTPKRIDSGNE